MTDFQTAFTRGLQAANRAAMARAELDAIFSDLNNALEAATNGNASIRRTSVPSITNAMTRAMTMQDENEPTSIAIFGASGEPPPFREIARWRQPATGFPCTLIWELRHVLCEDAQALREELIELLESPNVGYAIKSIVGVD